MRENVDELLQKYKTDIGTLWITVADVFPRDQSDFYDDLFVMRFVMTMSGHAKNEGAFLYL